MACGNFLAMSEPEHTTLRTNGIQMSCVQQGEGPLVVMCHGFPESWYSWRHQLPALAAAGYRGVALDMRGYGGTDKPEAIGAYTLSHLIGDVIGAIAALGETQAVVVGHDWGAPVAWYSALMRPDVVRAVAVLSVPYNPPLTLPPGLRLTQLMAANAGDREYYRLYFQEPGVAEAEFEADVRGSLARLLYAVSGDILADGVRAEPYDGHFEKGKGMVEGLPLPSRQLAWLREADLDFFTTELSRSGFRGGLNWYRNIDALPGILAPFVGTTIRSPALYLYGEHDMIAGNRPEALAAMQASLPELRAVVKLDGAGHWLQQERPDDVNRELLAFLGGL